MISKLRILQLSGSINPESFCVYMEGGVSELDTEKNSCMAELEYWYR